MSSRKIARTKAEADVAGLTRALVRAGAAIGARMANDSGLHATDARALRALDEIHGELPTLGHLAARLDLSPGAVTALVDRLEDAGMVQRIRDTADRRRVLLQITPAARNLAAASLAPIGESIQSVASELTDADSTIVADYLRAVIARLSEDTRH